MNEQINNECTVEAIPNTTFNRRQKTVLKWQQKKNSQKHQAIKFFQHASAGTIAGTSNAGTSSTTAVGAAV